MAESLIVIPLQLIAEITIKELAREVNLVRGVDAEVRNLTSNLRTIRAVLEDAEKRQVKEATVKLWLEELIDVAYDIDDVLDEWNTALLGSENEQQKHVLEKLRSFILDPCFCFSQVGLRLDIAHKIKELNGRLDAIATRKNNYNFQSGSGNHQESARIITTSVLDVPEVYGREDDEKKIKELLIGGNSEAASLRIISLIGMGGLGKTTLARWAYHAKFASHFDKRIWVCVCKPFDDRRIAIEILESLGGNTNLVGMNNILDEIRRCISKKKILLILDDVWTEDSTRWVPLKDSLKSGSVESRILITTRKEKVAVVMGSTDMVPIGLLNSDACWKLFTHLAFHGRPSGECEDLKDVGRAIVERCNGLPLAVKTVGSMLRSKTTKHQWQSVLDSEMWEIEDVEEGVFGPLLVSYYDLPSILRQCFTYCAIFPEDYVIKKGKLIKLWMAQGFLKEIQHKEMEMFGEEYFNELAMRSFFQDFKMNEKNQIVECKLHDIFHNLAQFLMQKECWLVKLNDLEKPWKVNLPLESTVRHSMLTLQMESGATFPILMNGWNKVRSLLVELQGLAGELKLEVEDNSFEKLTCLRALDLSGARERRFYKPMEALTNKIAKFKHLRYLNFSGNDDLKILPESLCQLYNLQTLDISQCENLCQLPCGIGELKSLRHLENEVTPSLRFLPEGIKRLACLRTLKEFIIGSLESKSTCHPCKLGDLGNLGQLQGSLLMRGLRNVVEANEAREAQLSNMTDLRQLTLQFDRWRTEGENEADVVEALQPPPLLESLCIRDSLGPVLFPSWMTSLSMLKEVGLYHCYKWKKLPPMGKLRFLESLRIEGMWKVTEVREEFLGIEREKEEEEKEKGQTTNIIAFPNLKQLEFGRMYEWEDWSDCWWLMNEWEEITGRRGISIMPRLLSFKISDCPKLKALPGLFFSKLQLQSLEIRGCPILKKSYDNGNGYDWQYICHIPTIQIDGRIITSSKVKEETEVTHAESSKSKDNEIKLE